MRPAGTGKVTVNRTTCGSSGCSGRDVARVAGEPIHAQDVLPVSQVAGGVVTAAANGTTSWPGPVSSASSVSVTSTRPGNVTVSVLSRWTRTSLSPSCQITWAGGGCPGAA